MERPVSEREWLVSYDRIEKAITRYEHMVRIGHVERPALMDAIMGARNPEREFMADKVLAKRFGI